MKITDKLTMLEVLQGQRMIYPVVVSGPRNKVIIDAGNPGQADTIVKALENEGIDPKSINNIAFTHQDMDHIGGANELRYLISGAIMHAHVLDRPHINGAKPPVKMQKRIDNYNMLSQQEQAQVSAALRRYYNNVVRINETLVDRGSIYGILDLTVIHTPGHTPGHVCFYSREANTLIVGDALNVTDGALTGPNPMYTYDMDRAISSLSKLLDFHADIVLTYHGGKFEGDVNGAIKKILEEYTPASEG